MSCAPSGDEGPTVYIQTKDRNKTKNKNDLFHVQIKIPLDCQIFRRIQRIEKHIPIGVVEPRTWCLVCTCFYVTPLNNGFPNIFVRYIYEHYFLI
jgi:hypothetical protein